MGTSLLDIVVALRSADLDSESTLLLVAMYSHDVRKGRCKASASTLARETRLSRNTVLRRRRGLEKAGYVTGEGSSRRRTYRVNVARLAPAGVQSADTQKNDRNLPGCVTAPARVRNSTCQVPQTDTLPNGTEGSVSSPAASSALRASSPSATEGERIAATFAKVWAARPNETTAPDPRNADDATVALRKRSATDLEALLAEAAANPEWETPRIATIVGKYQRQRTVKPRRGRRAVQPKAAPGQYDWRAAARAEGKPV